LVYLDDAGHLTDVRTAAVAAMTARELRRPDRSIGILGSGIQARLTAYYHQRVLPLEQIYLWGRNSDRATACAADIRAGFSRVFPRIRVDVLDSPAAVAQATRLIVTCTASRAPLLDASDLQPGTHISAVGSDSPGKQELHPAILRVADLVLADSLPQCEKLGELQHAPEQAARAIEIGKFCEQPHAASSSVADFTGLGVEDLFIAELIYANRNV
jgi:ornithine cyclodeaminase